MAIRVVPVTGSGGGMTASPQGRSVHPQPTLNKYPIPQSGAGAFSKAFSPYLQMAMKKSQDLQKRKEIAGMKSAYDAGDTDAFNIGPSPRPGVGMDYEQTLATNALTKAKMEATAENVKARIEGRNQNTQLIQSMLTLRQGRGFGQEKDMANLQSQLNISRDNNNAKNALTKIGKLHANDVALLGKGKALDFQALQFTQTSINNRQVYDLDFKDGQNGDKRKHDREMKVLQDKLTQGRDSNMFANDMEKQEYLSSVKERMQMKKHAFTSGENNLNRTSTEVIAANGLASAEKISANRLKVKTDIANIQNLTKRWSTKYTAESRLKMQTNEFGYRDKARVSDQDHERLIQEIGHGYNQEMASVNAKIKREAAYLNQEFTEINKEIDRATGQDKIRLTKELESVEARMKHNEDKEMAGVNAYHKEEIGLKFRAFDRDTKITIEDIKAKAVKYKTMQGSAKLGATMRKEFNAMTDDFITGLEPVYMNAVEAMRKNSPAGDKAILFAYARYLKPDSTELRKHTVTTLENMSGLPGFLRDMWRKVKGGKEILNPAERKDIFSRLQIFHKKHLENYQGKLKTYQGMAELSQVDPRLISDLSMSKNIRPFAEGEGSGATETGAYMSDTDLPDFGISQMILEATGGMGGDSSQNIQGFVSGQRGDSGSLPPGVTMQRTR